MLEERTNKRYIWRLKVTKKQLAEQLQLVVSNFDFEHDMLNVCQNVLESIRDSNLEDLTPKEACDMVLEIFQFSE